MLKPLRLALLYGHLVVRGAHVYHPGGARPVCTLSFAREMLKFGLLVKNGSRFELTERGRSFAV
jgi:hypothetical protein